MEHEKIEEKGQEMGQEMRRCWVYKWDENKAGTFYGLDEEGSTVVGKVNLSVETGASNWLLLFYKKPFELPSYLKVVRTIYDDQVWWCTPERSTPQDFAAKKHECKGVYVFFDSLDVTKIAYFI